DILDRLAARLVDLNVYTAGNRRPQILISPCIAEVIAKGGFSKQGMKQYLWEHAVFPAQRYERLRHHVGFLCDSVREGSWPKRYCESANPDRLVPVVWSPDHIMITVSGDPGRDNCLICSQNGKIGYPTSRQIRLPANWAQLLREARKA
ncbi:MAG: hypothetical protein HY673_25700, partial [Chloroflexi bacterium]|nr:hypothetical protein [Chloroflexota bacterium]